MPTPKPKSKPIKETKINQGGLYRCCITFAFENENELVHPGDKKTCSYCKNTIKLDDNFIWQWEPTND